MTTQSTAMTIADYCAAINRGEIQINREYQRSDKVWPESARSFLIESILLGFPVPKFYLYFKYDTKNRSLIKDIVDGQQRTAAIKDYYEDRFSLSNSLETEELRGHKFSTLPEEWHAKFVTYAISFDQFIGVSNDYVRQIFRRMNSYTVPLNPEELRHAEWQGKLKWFILRLADKYSTHLFNLGVLSDKSIVRMQDLKLYSELTHALIFGVTTTSRKDLDRLYKQFDVLFDQESELQRQLEQAFSMMAKMPYLKGTALAKPYQIYSLVVAICRHLRDTASQVPYSLASIDESDLERSILALSDAVDRGPDGPEAALYGAFLSASSEKTNVRKERETRISFYLKAIEVACTRA